MDGVVNMEWEEEILNQNVISYNYERKSKKLFKKS